MKKIGLRCAALALIAVLALSTIWFFRTGEDLGAQAERLRYHVGYSMGAAEYTVDFTQNTARYANLEWDGGREVCEIDLTDKQTQMLRQAISAARIERWKPEYGADVDDSCGSYWTLELTVEGEVRTIHGYEETSRRLPALRDALHALFY